MITLRNLYTIFGHDPKWTMFASKSLQPMVAVFLRKLGDKDIATITDFDLQMQLAMSQQPEDVKAKAESCMSHFRRWAKEKGKPFAEIQEQPIEPEPKPQPKPATNKRSRKKLDTIHDHEVTQQELLDWSGIELRGWPTNGSVYEDTSSNGIQSGTQRMRKRWVAEFYVGSVHFRHRSKYRIECEEWAKAVRMGRIKPWENGPDWRRLEQKKNLEMRYGEKIISAAEEACLLLKYHETNDLTDICDYMQRRMLPHMIYYSARSLRLGRKTVIDAAVQCVGILLTDITAGKPVTDFTRQAKRMMRIYKAHRSFWYYDKAPQDIRNIVDGLDLSGLSDIWKLTKDKRI